MTRTKSHGRERSPAHLSALQLVAYGSPMIPLAMGFTNLIMLLPTYYGRDLGLGLGAVGVVLALGRIFDFVTDPLIGDLSDRTKTPLGPRKPWVLVGLALFSFACFGLFSPFIIPDKIYLLVFACLYFLSFTLTDVPLSALGLEISQNKHERTRLAGSKTIQFIIGGVIGAIIPALWHEDLSKALQYTAIAVSIASVLVLPIFVFFTPNTTLQKPRTAGRFFQVHLSLITNRNLRRIIGIFFLLIFSAALAGSLSLMFVSYVLKAPEFIGPIWMINGLGLICGVPVWYLISKKLGKVRTWRMGILLGCCAGMPLLLLGSGDYFVMMAVTFAIGVCGAAEAMMPVSLLADHVAEMEVENGSGDAGRISGLKNAVSKLSIIGPLAIAFPILGAMGLSSELGEAETLGFDLSLEQHLILVGLYAGVPLCLRGIAWILMPKLWPELGQTIINEDVDN